MTEPFLMLGGVYQGGEAVAKVCCGTRDETMPLNRAAQDADVKETASANSDCGEEGYLYN